MKNITRATLILSLVVLMLVSMVSAEKYVQVNCSGQAIDQISQYSTPAIGKTYLLMNITIANHGYNDVYTNPNHFQVEVNKVKYGYDSASYNLARIGIPILDTNAHLADGGQISGYLVFQIPADTTEYELIYDPGYPPMTVRYNYI